MDDNHCPIVSWNVRGLNMPAKRDTVCEAVAAHRPAILYLQETKIDNWSPALVRDVGGSRLADCVVLPAIGSRGGVAILWDNQIVSIVSHVVGEFAITAKVTVLRPAATFWLTTVYGPAKARKDVFLLELARSAPPQVIPGYSPATSTISTRLEIRTIST